MMNGKTEISIPSYQDQLWNYAIHQVFAGKIDPTGESQLWTVALDFLKLAS